MSAKDHRMLETAALHAIGALPPGEAAAFEEHLAGCPLCRDGIEELRGAVDALHRSAPESVPGDFLREKLMAAVRSEKDAAAAPVERPRLVQAWKEWTSSREMPPEVIVPAGNAVWEPTGSPGVEVRRLFVDEAADRATMLIRMAPNTSYPAHRHAGPEECYVLEGDLLSGGRRMKAGDYKWSNAGSADGVQSTRDGCVLFIVSSLKDELLPLTP